MEKPGYRRDIDGLRAVAVLGVVWFHAFPKKLPGGFIGVDVFFVISGYLIAGILFRELNRGTFRFSDFYARRVRRLVPALLVLGVLVMGCGTFLLLQDEFEQLGKHWAASTVFLQNWVFQREVGYFERAAETKPLLHLWSLAVEEQFYLFFPPVLLWGWKRAAGRVPWVLWGLLGVSLGLSVAASLGAVGNAFFLLPYRAWELAAGALLAWYEGTHSARVLREPGKAVWAAGTGLALVCGGMLWMRQAGVYPGWRALVPVLGSLLLIASGPGTHIHRWVLSNRPMVWVGLLSYPLYLFHWPLLVFVHLVDQKKVIRWHVSAAVLIAAVLAALTYLFIEKRLRHAASRWVVPALTAGFVAMGGVGLLAWQQTVLKTTSATALQRVEQAVKDTNSFVGLTEFHPERFIFAKHTGGEGPQTLFVGDSHIQHLIPRVHRLLQQSGPADRGAIFLARGATPPLPGTLFKGERLVTIGSPEKFYAELEEILRGDARIDRVVLGARWGMYFGFFAQDYLAGGEPFASETGKDLAFQALADLLARVGKGKKTFLLLGCPSSHLLHPKDSRVKRTFTGCRLGSRKVFTVEQHLAEEGWLRTRLQQTAHLSGTMLLDPLPVLTGDGLCLFENEQGPIRYDESHLRPSFSRDHATFIDPAVLP
jgi:peptidoglycan/LPS O-acetylase OafA/YrhL